MIIEKTNFKDLIIIKSPVFKDRRGFFREIYKKKNFKKKVNI